MYANKRPHTVPVASEMANVEITSDSTPLSLADLGILQTLLQGTATKWLDLGLQLGLHPNVLDEIQAKPLLIVEGVRGYFREMLSEWLGRVRPLPTLEALIEALYSRTVGEERKAYELKGKFLAMKASPKWSQPAIPPNILTDATPTDIPNNEAATDLFLDDLVDISEYLLILDKEQIFSLGLVLGLSFITLEPIRSSRLFLDDMLAAWLQGKDSVSKRGGHTWQALVNGLRHQKVNQTEIASKIQKERC